MKLSLSVNRKKRDEAWWPRSRVCFFISTPASISLNPSINSHCAVYPVARYLKLISYAMSLMTTSDVETDFKLLLLHVYHWRLTNDAVTHGWLFIRNSFATPAYLPMPVLIQNSHILIHTLPPSFLWSTSISTSNNLKIPASTHPIISALCSTWANMHTSKPAKPQQSLISS